MIQIDDLEFGYGNQGFRLQIPSLRVAAGEKIAVLGRSGTGKSTFLQLIAGVVLPSRGSVRIHQTVVNQLSESQRRHFRISRIGFVFQEFELVEHLSVRDNIRLPYLIQRSMPWSSKAIADLQTMSEWCGLVKLLNRYPHQLSQGERQRVAVCRALITRPQLILADEPTGSLDMQTGNDVMELLLKQTAELSATLLMVTHDLGLASRLERTIELEEFHPTAGLAGGR